jgi:hypothetical protein
VCLMCFFPHYILVDFVDCGPVVCRVNILFVYLFACNPFNYEAFFNFLI